MRYDPGMPLMRWREGRFDPLSNQVIGAAIEVHRHLGPGLLESAYELCLAEELAPRIELPAHILQRARLPIERMLEISAKP